MGDLASIGYNGQPARNPFRVVRPPISVLIDLTVLFPREPHRSGRFQPNGLQLHKVVEGRLTCWGICEQGDWWGLVTYPIAYGSKRKNVTHWVPAWTLRETLAVEYRAELVRPTGLTHCRRRSASAAGRRHPGQNRCAAG